MENLQMQPNNFKSKPGVITLLWGCGKTELNIVKR